MPRGDVRRRRRRRKVRRPSDGRAAIRRCSGLCRSSAAQVLLGFISPGRTDSTRCRNGSPLQTQNGTAPSTSWRFPSGASLSFGYLDTEADKYRYQSAEYQFIGFDELTQFSESQYTYMFSRLRRLKGSSVPLRMRGASNPGGYGHEWVKQRFITRRGEGGRIFIPASSGPRSRAIRDVTFRVSGFEKAQKFP